MKPLKVFNEEGQITQFKTKRYKAKNPENFTGYIHQLLQPFILRTKKISA